MMLLPLLALARKALLTYVMTPIVIGVMNMPRQWLYMCLYSGHAKPRRTGCSDCNHETLVKGATILLQLVPAATARTPVTHMVAAMRTCM